MGDTKKINEIFVLLKNMKIKVMIPLSIPLEDCKLLWTLQKIQIWIISKY